MDGFERITGFAEGDGTDVRARLKVDGVAIVNIVTGRRNGMGRLEIVSLAELRERVGALLNHRRGASPQVLLTRLGGGAFGNDDRWIDVAMERALGLVAGQGLEVFRVVR